MAKVTISIIIGLLFWPITTAAHGNRAAAVDQGRNLAEQLQEEQLQCEAITDEDYEQLGEYYYELMGNHEAMDEYMEEMMTTEEAEVMHQTIGKRFSGCNPSAQWSPQLSANNMMGMMMMGGMMGQGYSSMMGAYSNGVSSWLVPILFWLIFVTGIGAIIALVVQLSRGKR